MGIDGTWIEFTNWGKFNPRKFTKPTWFRMEKTLFTCDEFTGFSHSEYVALLYLFCQACEKGGNGFKLVFAHCKRDTKLRESQLESCIKKLKSRGVLQENVTPKIADVTPTCPTNGRTDDTNERAENSVFSVGDKSGEKPETPRPGESLGDYIRRLVKTGKGFESPEFKALIAEHGVGTIGKLAALAHGRKPGAVVKQEASA